MGLGGCGGEEFGEDPGEALGVGLDASAGEGPCEGGNKIRTTMTPKTIKSAPTSRSRVLDIYVKDKFCRESSCKVNSPCRKIPGRMDLLRRSATAERVLSFATP